MLRRPAGTGFDLIRLRNRETAIAFLLNATVSAILCACIFGTSGRIPLRGLSSFHLDFVPHSFMTILMGTVIPGLIARRAALRAGVGAGVPRKVEILRFGLLRALAITPFLLGGVALGLWLIAGPDIAAVAAVALKCVYGGMLAGAVTPAAVRRGAGAEPARAGALFPQLLQRMSTDERNRPAPRHG